MAIFAADRHLPAAAGQIAADLQLFPATSLSPLPCYLFAAFASYSGELLGPPPIFCPPPFPEGSHFYRASGRACLSRDSAAVGNCSPPAAWLHRAGVKLARSRGRANSSQILDDPTKAR